MEKRKINGGSFPLSLAAEGENVRITAIKGGRGVGFKLTELGLPVGSELMLTQRNSGGPVVVACRDTRIALGAGMAHRIMVAPVMKDS